MEFSVRNAVATDVDAIRCALRAAGLPVEGVDSQVDGIFVCESSGVVQGVAGLEVYGTDGLLRSVVVNSQMQRLGIGALLCGRVVDRAKTMGCDAVYLLTLDAAVYFEGLGFEILARDQAPAGIRSSDEFSRLCPASAMLMRRFIER